MNLARDVKSLDGEARDEHGKLISELRQRRVRRSLLTSEGIGRRVVSGGGKRGRLIRGNVPGLTDPRRALSRTLSSSLPSPSRENALGIGRTARTARRVKSRRGFFCAMAI